MAVRVIAASFIGSYPSESGLPKARALRVAIAGRSNVGKSSFINQLTNRKQLAHASSMPGRTRHLNLFALTLRSGTSNDAPVEILDLPGFGFARAPKAERERLHALIVSCLRSCPGLEAVCLLNDCRRMPEADELIIRDLTQESGYRFVVVLTKVDKLKRQELATNRQGIAKQYGLRPEELLLAGRGVHPENLWERLRVL